MLMYSYQIDLSHVEAVYDHVKEIFPHISLAGRSGGQWTGAMPFSGDGRPFVGSLRLLGNKFSGLWISGM
jgi:glycine/D-amino acid oxidase-like deaminating enzyme